MGARIVTLLGGSHPCPAVMRWWVACVAGMLLLTGEGFATVSASPTEVIKRTIDEVLRILSDENMKQPDYRAHRRQLLEEIIGDRFDYEEMSKRTLAKQWKKLNAGEKQEFVEVFRAFLSDAYAHRIEDYSGEQVQYLRERRKDGFAEVQTKIVSSKVELPINYRLVNKSGEWRVYDVVIDGISLVKNYRSQFYRIIRSSSYEELVEKLRRKPEEFNKSLSEKGSTWLHRDRRLKTKELAEAGSGEHSSNSGDLGEALGFPASPGLLTTSSLNLLVGRCSSHHHLRPFL